MTLARPSPLRCLIVEDQRMFSQLLQTMLAALAGLEVCGSATSLAEAQRLCSTPPLPDLLLLDLSLPDGDGLEAALTLVRHQPEARIVVLSGQASSFICPGALQAHCLGVVDKTAAFADLQRLLLLHLSREPAPLTPRQRQIYALIGQGRSNKEIAQGTGLSVATVETHRKTIAQKLGVSGAELVRQAALLGPLSLEEAPR